MEEAGFSAVHGAAESTGISSRGPHAGAVGGGHKEVHCLQEFKITINLAGQLSAFIISVHLRL